MSESLDNDRGWVSPSAHTDIFELLARDQPVVSSQGERSEVASTSSELAAAVVTDQEPEPLRDQKPEPLREQKAAIALAAPEADAVAPEPPELVLGDDIFSRLARGVKPVAARPIKEPGLAGETRPSWQTRQEPRVALAPASEAIVDADPVVTSVLRPASASHTHNPAAVIVEPHVEFVHEAPRHSIPQQGYLGIGNEFRYDLPLTNGEDDPYLNQLTIDVRATLPVEKSTGDNKERALATEGDFPAPAKNSLVAYDQAKPVFTGVARFSNDYHYYWLAPSFFHRPLYFEQPNVERYGHYVHGDLVQSAISSAHFFGTLAIVPYKLGASPHQTCDYTLGRYRPGSCNPKHITYEPFSYRGAAYQGLAVGGAVFLLP